MLLKAVDRDLLKKYDTPGPRYTSYPTAPVFTGSFDAKAYQSAIIQNNRPGSAEDLLLYLHIPFCYSLCYFCGCTTLITKNRQLVAEYLEYLKKEIDLVVRHIAHRRKVVQIHLGGGSPSYVRPEEIEELMLFLQERFRFAPNVETGIEIDPRGIAFDQLLAMRRAGLNRVSIGVQDFDPQVQAAVSRVQSEELTRKVFAWCRALSFDSINADLIYGLPLQSEESFQETIEKMIEIAPDRIALFNFAYIPWMKPHQKLIHREDLPSAEIKLAILKMAIERFTSAG